MKLFGVFINFVQNHQQNEKNAKKLIKKLKIRVDLSTKKG